MQDQESYGRTLVRRFNALMDELEEMTAAAGGMAHRIPADQRAAWQERKRQLIADIEADRAAEVAA
jgi:hypothetical protein